MHYIWPRSSGVELDEHLHHRTHRFGRIFLQEMTNPGKGDHGCRRPEVSKRSNRRFDRNGPILLAVNAHDRDRSERFEIVLLGQLREESKRLGIGDVTRELQCPAAGLRRREWAGIRTNPGFVHMRGALETDPLDNRKRGGAEVGNRGLEVVALYPFEPVMIGNACMPSGARAQGPPQSCSTRVTF